VDGAYVNFEGALAGFIRICDRVGYIRQHVTTFVNRRTREKLHNYWHVGIAADGFPLRPGVGAFQLALEVRDLLRPRLDVCAAPCVAPCIALRHSAARPALRHVVLRHVARFSNASFSVCA
jgi:hypothetical protein